MHTVEKSPVLWKHPNLTSPQKLHILKTMLSSLVSVSGNFPIWVMKTEIPIRASAHIYQKRKLTEDFLCCVCVHF